MFKTLYRCPRTIPRHENGPLNESRRRYLYSSPFLGKFFLGLIFFAQQKRGHRAV